MKITGLWNCVTMVLQSPATFENTIRSIFPEIWLRNDKHIISSISVTAIVVKGYLRKWNYRTIPKVKTCSYFLSIP